MIFRFYVNKLAFYISLTFVISILLSRLFMPFGDEPDFSSNVNSFINAHPEILVTYSYFDVFLDNHYLNSECYYQPGLFSNSLVSRCNEELLLRLLRFFISSFYALPLLIFLVISAKANISSSESRIVPNPISFLFAMLLPGVTYLLGAISLEVIWIIFSFVFFVTPHRAFKVLVLLAAYLLDPGNSMVLLAFIVWVSLFIYLKKRFNSLVYLVFLLFLIIAIVFTQYIFEISLFLLPGFSEKIRLIFEFTNGEEFNPGLFTK